MLSSGQGVITRTNTCQGGAYDLLSAGQSSPGGLLANFRHGSHDPTTRPLPHFGQAGQPDMSYASECLPDSRMPTEQR